MHPESLEVVLLKNLRLEISEYQTATRLLQLCRSSTANLLNFSTGDAASRQSSIRLSNSAISHKTEELTESRLPKQKTFAWGGLPRVISALASNCRPVCVFVAEFLIFLSLVLLRAVSERTR